MYATIVRTGVDVSLVGGGCRREVATDEGLEDAMATESHQGAVVRMWCMVEHIVGSEAVVEVCGVVLGMIVSIRRTARH